MTALPDEHVFSYPFTSTLQVKSRRKLLQLATFNANDAVSPYFFEGRLANPKRIAAPDRWHAGLSISAFDVAHEDQSSRHVGHEIGARMTALAS
jgi:hypothetical protein